MGFKKHVWINDDSMEEWVEKKLEDKTFSSWSHAVELALTRLRREMSSEPF